MIKTNITPKTVFQDEYESVNDTSARLQRIEERLDAMIAICAAKYGQTPQSGENPDIMKAKDGQFSYSND